MSAGDGTEVRPGHRSIVERLVALYGLTLLSISPVPDSVLNDNYRVVTSDGPRFARLHATRRDEARLRREHRVAAWVHQQGLPAVPPLAARDGQSLHRIGGVFVSLYPWIDGRHARRGAVSAAEAATLGDLLGRLHVALAGYEEPLVAGKAGSTWDTDDAINQLSRVDDLIRYYPAPPEHQLATQLAIRAQLELLEGGAALPPSAFDHLPKQPCHGDFHERNVLLGPGGNVAGIVDWEFISLLPRVYELLRAVEFLGLDVVPSLLAVFLGAYRAHAGLDPDMCRAGVEMRWQATLHDTWAYRAVFIEGSQRAARFLEEHASAVRRFADPAFREDLARRLVG